MNIAKTGFTLFEKLSKGIGPTKPLNLSEINFEGLRYMKNAKTDVFCKGRWNLKPEEYILNCKIPNSSIPSHHRIDGWNSSIRDVDELKKGILDDCQMSGGFKAIKADKEFAELTPTEKDTIGYRIISKINYARINKPFHIIKQAQVGDIVKLDEGCAYVFQREELISLNHCNPKTNILEVIRIPKGARVSRNMENGGEILMPRGAEYKLVSKEINAEGEGVVVLEYILPKSKYPTDIEEIKKVALQNINSEDDYNRKFAQKILDEVQDMF